MRTLWPILALASPSGRISPFSTSLMGFGSRNVRRFGLKVERRVRMMRKDANTRSARSAPENGTRLSESGWATRFPMTIAEVKSMNRRFAMDLCPIARAVRKSTT